MADDNDDLPPNVPPPPPPISTAAMAVKLPAFWPDAPVAWFAAAEAQFTLRRLTSQVDKFCLLTSALDKDSLKKVIHLVTAPSQDTPYTDLKEALLISHHLTDFQKVEMLLAMDSLGGRKPSQMLADMLEVCPAGQQNNIIFVGLFLQRLPRELRILLSHENHADVRALAAKADTHMAYNGRQSHDVVAAVPEEVEIVAAIGTKNQRGKFKRPPPIPQRPQQHGRSTQQSSKPPVVMAQQSTGLCYYHWTYGEKANSCKSPCTWSGN